MSLVRKFHHFIKVGHNVGVKAINGMKKKNTETTPEAVDEEKLILKRLKDTGRQLLLLPLADELEIHCLVA